MTALEILAAWALIGPIGTAIILGAMHKRRLKEERQITFNRIGVLHGQAMRCAKLVGEEGNRGARAYHLAYAKALNDLALELSEESQ